jgi:hypothetical protein
LIGDKAYIGFRVETSDGNVGMILNYDEITDTYDVQLESGQLRLFKSSALVMLSSDSDRSAPELFEPPSNSGGTGPSGKGPGPCGEGGTDDW